MRAYRFSHSASAASPSLSTVAQQRCTVSETSPQISGYTGNRRSAWQSTASWDPLSGSINEICESEKRRRKTKGMSRDVSIRKDRREIMWGRRGNGTLSS